MCVVTVCLPGPTANADDHPGPTLTPSADRRPIPIPPNCIDILANGDFEWDGAWIAGGTPIVPFYAGPPNPVLSGNRSMALGAVTVELDQQCGLLFVDPAGCHPSSHSADRPDPLLVSPELQRRSGRTSTARS